MTEGSSDCFSRLWTAVFSSSSNTASILVLATSLKDMQYRICSYKSRPLICTSWGLREKVIKCPRNAPRFLWAK